MHTPTPWNIHKGLTPVSGDSIFSEESGYEVARIPRFDATIMGDEYEGNTAFIVQACNAHDALVAQRDELVAALEEAWRVICWAAQESQGKVRKEIVGGWLDHAARINSRIAKARQC